MDEEFEAALKSSSQNKVRMVDERSFWHNKHHF